MTARTFLLVFALAFLASPHRLTAGAPPAENAKIEALISHLENLKDATFIRNGRDYDAKTAAKFLRGKWQANEKKIRTAAEFIAKAATVSSTSGKPYMIRFNDGSEKPCAEYLSAQLKRL